MFRVAICDDNIDFVEYERNLVCNCLSRISNRYECDTFYSGQEFLQIGKKIDSYDLVILDCKMDNVDGVKTAELIRKQNEEVKIIFSTDYYEFSQNACDFEPIGYLLKNSPDFESRLIKKIHTVYSKSTSKHKYITDFKEGTYKVDIKNIVYICSDDHYLHFYLKSNDENAKQLSCLNKRGRLDDLAGKLDDSFVRVNYSHLVNMAYITSIAGGVVTVKSGDAVLQITIRRGTKDYVEESFNKYIGAIEW